jgi:phosphoglucosamine mutase
VLIGKDTRCPAMLEDRARRGLCSMGVDVRRSADPDPGARLPTVDMRCDAGAMISASHNAFEDNGVKFFSREGWKPPTRPRRGSSA